MTSPWITTRDGKPVPRQIRPPGQAALRMFGDDVYKQAAIEMLGKPVRGRSCGSCTACCTQVPVELPEGNKPANTRCRHQRATGCGIYKDRPLPCVVWSCRWLFDADTAELRRPDKSGVVLDCMPDTILVEGEPMLVIQAWVDPKRRDAHREPALRAYLARVCEQSGMFVLVRWSSSDGMVLIPPHANDTGEWFEHGSANVSAERMAAGIAAAGKDHSDD